MRASEIFASSVVRKYLMALSGLGLVGFIIVHLLGNLALYDSSGESFNRYAQMLHDLGSVLILAELGLIVVFLMHIVLAFRLHFQNKAARPHAYAVSIHSKGGPSRWNSSSVYMIVTGIVLLSFLVMHILQFKFGPGMQDGYITTINERQVWDLFRIVRETFQDPFYVGIYTLSMTALGWHLRHGFWSAFQSLGLLAPRYDCLIRMVGYGLVILLTAGFLSIPLYMFIVH